MKIPEGYRELLEGEIIKNDDLVFFNNKWTEEGCLSNKWTGRKYEPPPYCYFKIRKIDENKSEISKEKIHLILETLRQNRAFNADSAFYPVDDEYLIYLELEKKKIIKSIDYDKSGKRYFYLDKKDKNQLFLKEIFEEKT